MSARLYEADDVARVIAERNELAAAVERVEALCTDTNFAGQMLTRRQILAAIDPSRSTRKDTHE